MRGDGWLYRRGEVWWASYVIRGQRIRTTTGKSNKREAKDWLDSQREAAKQGISNPRADKIAVGELVEQWFKAREMNSKPTITDKYRWNKNLKPFFEKCKVAD